MSALARSRATHRCPGWARTQRRTPGSGPHRSELSVSPSSRPSTAMPAGRRARSPSASARAPLPPHGPPTPAAADEGPWPTQAATRSAKPSACTPSPSVKLPARLLRSVRDASALCPRTCARCERERVGPGTLRAGRPAGSAVGPHRAALAGRKGGEHRRARHAAGVLVALLQREPHGLGRSHGVFGRQADRRRRAAVASVRAIFAGVRAGRRAERVGGRGRGVRVGGRVLAGRRPRAVAAGRQRGARRRLGGPGARVGAGSAAAPWRRLRAGHLHERLVGGAQRLQRGLAQQLVLHPARGRPAVGAAASAAAATASTTRAAVSS